MSSSISVSSGHAHRPSPRDMLQSTLASGISSGKIAAADKDALSSAIDTVDAGLKGSAPARGSRHAPPSREDMQAKVATLIDQQVADGKLSSDQAGELKQVFSDTFAGGPGGSGGPVGGRGPGGPGGPGGPPPKGGSDDDADESTTLTISTDNSDIASLLQDFMKQLIEKASSSSYSAAGQSATKAQTTSFMLDLQA